MSPAPDATPPDSAHREQGLAAEPHDLTLGIEKADEAEVRRRLNLAQERLDLLTTLLDLIPDFFYVHDFDLRYQYANEAAARYFQLSKDQLIGRLLRDVEHDREQAAFYEQICQQVMRDGLPRITDALPLKMRDGTVRYLRQHDYPFKHPVTGQPMLLGLSRDVTVERELIEERVRRERLERDLEIARVIQRAILPAGALEISGFEVAGLSRPSAYAAGDFYDWWHPDDGRALMCIADVTGHGIGPALLAAECRAYSRALLRGGSTLSADVAKLNAALCRDLSEGRFITFAAIDVDVAARRVSVLSAGHGPILWYQAQTGRVDEIDSHGPPLGIDDAMTFDAPIELTVSPGDAVVVLTDGIHEAARGDGERFGLERLRYTLSECSRHGAQTMIDHLVARALDFAGSEQLQDDMTAIVVRGV